MKILIKIFITFLKLRNVRNWLYGERERERERESGTATIFTRLRYDIFWVLLLRSTSITLVQVRLKKMNNFRFFFVLRTYSLSTFTSLVHLVFSLIHNPSTHCSFQHTTHAILSRPFGYAVWHSCRMGYQTMADSRPKSPPLRLGHLRVGELQPLSPMYSTRPCCLVEAITRHTRPDPNLDSWYCLPH